MNFENNYQELLKYSINLRDSIINRSSNTDLRKLLNFRRQLLRDISTLFGESQLKILNNYNEEEYKQLNDRYKEISEIVYDELIRESYIFGNIERSNTLN